MENNTPYKTQAIDLSLLSVLDITKEGKVVSAEKWVELWTLVFQHINKIDAFCVDMQSTLDNWHTAEEALTELIADMQMKYETLSTGFTHYGENPPENPNTVFWARPVNRVDPNGFMLRSDLKYQGTLNGVLNIYKDDLEPGLYFIQSSSITFIGKDHNIGLDYIHTDPYYIDAGLLLVSNGTTSAKGEPYQSFQIFGTVWRNLEEEPSLEFGRAVHSVTIVLHNGYDEITESCSESEQDIEKLNQIVRPHPNSVFRGKNLGTSVSIEQMQKLKAGDFSDLYVGDYWRCQGHTYRIADINYFPDLNKPHLVIVTDEITDLLPIWQEGVDSSTAGYGYCTIRDTLKNALSTIGLYLTQGKLSFLSPTEYLNCFNQNGSLPKGTLPMSTRHELLSAVQLLGHDASGYRDPNAIYGPEKQFALFKLAPHMADTPTHSYTLRTQTETGYYLEYWKGHLEPIPKGYIYGHGIRAYFVLG